MIKVAITGLNGVIGNVLASELSKDSQIIDLFHTAKYSGKTNLYKYIKLDLLKKNEISKVLDKANPEIIVHLAAITHIDKCEKDKKNGKKGKVWRTNVDGTGEIAKFCAKNNIPMIFLSTECVFDGESKYFSERAKKKPLNWYGFTKSEAEDIAISSGAPVAIIRSVVAYHKNDSGKTIYGKILKELKSKKKVEAVSDQLFTPTYTYDIVKSIKIIMEKKLKGIFHVAPARIISPYELAVLIAKANNFPSHLVKATSINSYYGIKRGSLRLRNSSLLGRKTNKVLNFTPRNPENVI